MITRRLVLAILSLLSFAGPAAISVSAQDTIQRPQDTPAQSRDIDISGYAMLGLHRFTAVDTFETTIGSPTGWIFGGGARVGLPLGGLFVNVGGWQFRGHGERAFVFQGERFGLGVPLHVSITPIEISGGWRFKPHRKLRFQPYVAGGISSYGYKETSDFATDSENVDERFAGYHLAGGMSFPVDKWIGVAWEVNWTTVPDAIGTGGISEAFGETNLGGASFRLLVTIGQ